jgi:hypothetical protein
MKSGISKQKLAVFVVPQTRAWAECYDVLSTLSKLSWLLALCLFAQVCLKFWGVTRYAELYFDTDFAAGNRSEKSPIVLKGVSKTKDVREYVLLNMNEYDDD